jgi:hypothetical protein
VWLPAGAGPHCVTGPSNKAWRWEPYSRKRQLIAEFERLSTEKVTIQEAA